MSRKMNLKKGKRICLFITMIMTAGLLGCGNSKEAQDFVKAEEFQEAQDSTEKKDSEGMPVSRGEEPETEQAPASVEEAVKEEAGETFSFSDISNLEFWFGSGAGAWRTVLTVSDDGMFEGEYQDADMGS